MSVIVYVLTNPAMPDLIKIGKTTRDDLQARMGELYTTGVPLPFDCTIAVEVENKGDELEKALHVAFEPQRLNRSREFFEVGSSQVEAILKIWPDARDVTPEIERDLDKDLSSEEKEDARKFKRRNHRPNLNFRVMGIPDGSELVSTNGAHEKAIVIGEKKVSFRGEEMSLTAATNMALDLNYSANPCGRWTFESRNLSDIYSEVYGSSASVVYEDD